MGDEHGAWEYSRKFAGVSLLASVKSKCRHMNVR